MINVMIIINYYFYLILFN